LVFGAITDAASIKVAYAAEPVFLIAAIVTATIGGRWMTQRPATIVEAYAT
jgi:hypothetical protein